LKPWPIRHEPSQLQRGLSAVRIRPCLRGLPTASPHSGHGEIPALRPGTMLVVRPPGVLSPFASTAALPSSREAFKRFLREHYFSFVARTDSCANPSSLFSPSGVPLVREVFAGCTPPAASGIFPMLSLRILPWMPGPLLRRYRKVHMPVSSLASSAFPGCIPGRLPATSR
jgi:hypothetical protein